MTPDEHAAGIAEALFDLEVKAKAARKAAREVKAATAVLHQRLEAAQKAFNEAYPNVVQLRSGGADQKPPPSDDPVED